MGMFSNMILYGFIPGLFGGFALFLYALKSSLYKNNKLFRKALIELIGASITASFISLFFVNSEFLVAISFTIGLSWSGIIMIVRKKVTKLIDTIICEKLANDE